MTETIEVVIASSPVDAGISCWDLRTGAEQLRYRSCASSPHGLASVARRFLASSQLRDSSNSSSSSSSGSILYWSWDKPQVEVRSFPAEAIGPLISNSEGTYLVGGGKSGSIYLWEVSSGKLLKKWQAHFRSVTCLAFSDDESFLISGSEDGSVRFWSLLMIFDDAENTGPKRPFYSFSEHALRVTDVICGYGLSNSIVISASEDHTCKIWSLSKGKLLRSVKFPSVINAIAMDPGEHAFYAGSRDGKIYIAAINAECFPNSSYGMHITGCLSDQSKSINCLALSKDGVTLVSGSDDGTVRAWDTRSQHAIRVFKHAKGPVNNVYIIASPLCLNTQGTSSSQISSCKKRVHMPMPPPLEKYTNSMAGSIETKPVISAQSSWTEQLENNYCSYVAMKNQIGELQQQGSSGAAEMELERVKLEGQRSTQMAQQYKKLFQDLHKLFVNEIVDGSSQAAESR